MKPVSPAGVPVRARAPASRSVSRAALCPASSPEPDAPRAGLSCPPGRRETGTYALDAGTPAELHADLDRVERICTRSKRTSASGPPRSQKVRGRTANERLRETGRPSSQEVDSDGGLLLLRGRHGEGRGWSGRAGRETRAGTRFEAAAGGGAVGRAGCVRGGLGGVRQVHELLLLLKMINETGKWDE